MIERLQKKWKVSGWRLLLILITFAIGGSITGYLGKRIISFTGIENLLLYIPVYIIIITVIWPLMVLLISIPLGQFIFFKKYIGKIGKRIIGSRSEVHGSQQEKELGHQKISLNHAKGGSEKNANEGLEKPLTGNQKNLVIFASGAGSNARQIINYFKNSSLAKVALIVCNKPNAGVLSIAQKENIPFLIIEKERFFKGDGYLPELKLVSPALMILAGFLWKLPQCLIHSFPRRIINIHPALLPKYGGKGMYGPYVHEAVLNARDVQSGITIHYVDEQYDHGDTIFQTACPVLEGDTPEILAQRIHQLEHLHYPQVIEEVLKKN